MARSPASLTWDGTTLTITDASGGLLFSATGTNRQLVTKDLNDNLGAIKATSVATGTSGSETAITASAAELNASAGTGLDATELGLLNGATAGSITASKAVTRTAAQGVPLATLVVAATGANASDGAALTKDVNLITGADNTTCVVLPASVVGECITVVNTVANKTLPVFPAGTDNINGLGAGTAFTMGPARAATFICTAAGVWYAEKLAGATPNTTELALLTGAGTGGTAVASKVQVADANQNLGAVKATSLAIGTSGSETSLTATPTQLNSVGASIGAAAGMGVTAAETGFGHFKSTTLTLTDTPVPLVDEAGVIAYGGLKIYDFPQGYLYIQSAVADLAITKSSAGVNVDWDGDIGFGTAAAGNDADLTGTEQDIIPKTATPQAAAGATTGDGVSTATEHAIHDGTGGAKDLYVNLLVDDADHDVTGAACDLILNGTVTINWIFMGDN